MEIYPSAYRHGIGDLDIEHAVAHALVTAEDGEDTCLYLGPDHAGNLLEIVSVLREDGSELIIQAMRMRRLYEPMLRDLGEPYA